MKIAQVVCTLPPYGGGIGVVAHYYSHELSLLGHDVYVFKPKPHKIKKLDQENNYTVNELRPIIEVGHAAFLPQLLWRLRKFDVVHLHFPFLGAGIFVYLLKKIRRHKMTFVLSYHMDLVGNGYRKSFFKMYNKFFLQRIVKAADKVIVAATDYTENSNIRDYYLSHKDKFEEIPFGVRAAFKPEAKNPSLLKKYGIKFEDKIIGFVGGLDAAHYFKGVDQLIVALSRIDDPQVKAVIVGDGNFKKRYLELATQLGIADRVIFAGYVSAEILPDYYNLFDLFILPSIDQSEAFGLVLIEAMACGKPCIASNLKGVRSVVVPGLNGILIEPKNPADIVAKINHFLENPALMEQFGRNGQELVEKKYRWPIVVRSLNDVYKRLKRKNK